MNLGPGNCRKPFMRKVYCPALLKHADISQEVKAPCFFPRDMITAESRRNSHAVYTATGRAHFFLMGLGNMHDIYFFLDFSSFFLLSSLLSPLSSPIPGSLFSRFTLSLLHFLFLSFSFTFSTFFSSLFPSLTRAHLQSAHPSNFPSFPIYLTLPPPSFPLPPSFPERNGKDQHRAGVWLAMPRQPPGAPRPFITSGHKPRHFDLYRPMAPTAHHVKRRPRNAVHFQVPFLPQADLAPPDPG